MSATLDRYSTVYRSRDAADRVRDQIAATDHEWAYRVAELSPAAYVIIPIDEDGQEMSAL